MRDNELGLTEELLYSEAAPSCSTDEKAVAGAILHLAER